MKPELTLEDIRIARLAMAQVIHLTPLDFSHTFSGLIGGEVYFKQENLQKTGSFKIRGALNKIISLRPEEKTRGVIAASAGNHAQGVAFAAKAAGLDATIVMPEGAPLSKITATKGYGAKVILSGECYDEAFQQAQVIQQETGATFVHAFDDRQVITGQGTLGLEILEQLPDVGVVVVPVGGGGLIAGIATAIKALRPKVKVIGVQAAGAPGMLSCKKLGYVESSSQVDTIADGIAVKRPGELTFEIINRLVDDLVTVTDEEIAQAILMLLERNKTVAEGAGAVGVAALLNRRLNRIKGKIAVVISGGNIDVNMIYSLIERGLVMSGRHIRLRTVLLDKPGNLQRFLEVIAEAGANVISVAHDRTRTALTFTQAGVEVSLETRDGAHIAEITALLKNHGYPVEIVH
ncbi:MAG: threonine ammonia-lyase [Carboxydocellales bacterium]